MTKTGQILTTILLAALPRLCLAAEGQLAVKATTSCMWSDPIKPSSCRPANWRRLAKRTNQDSHQRQCGPEVLCQAVDTDFDACHTRTIVISRPIRARRKPRRSRYRRDQQVYTKDQYRAYGRFVRERFDDFAWENDRIAHRMSGKALETWAGEP